ncbi:hypothetical protein EJ07DRAFT_158969 [Lizonia empirigonia]|nr:hypothetical protein EJ07DRAFT_158969 [Lizonia empirigonia]
MHNLTQTNGVDHDLHTVMLQHCQDCSTFKKQWRIVNSRVEPVVIEPIVIGPSAQSSEAARFLKNTPSPKDWYKRQLEVVFTPQKYQSALSSLFTRDHATETTHRTQYPNSRIDIGKRFATLTNSSLQNSRLQKSFSYFQALVLLVYCAALEQTGTPGSEVDEILAVVTIFGSRRLKTLRKAALSAYGVIQRLVKVGWPESRATELFFLNPISPSSLNNLGTKCFDSIATTLEESVEYTVYKNNVCAALRAKVPQTLDFVHKVLPAKTVASFIITSTLEAAKPANKRHKRDTGVTSKKRHKRNDEVASKPRATTITITPASEDSPQDNDTIDASFRAPQSTLVSFRTPDRQSIPSSQDIPEHSPSPSPSRSLLSLTSPEVVDSSATGPVDMRQDSSSHKQVTTFNDGNEASEVRFRYSAPVPDNHNSHVPQPSGQNGPEHGTLTTTDVDQPLIEDYQAPYKDNANFHNIDRAGAMTQQDILTMPYTVGINDDQTLASAFENKRRLPRHDLSSFRMDDTHLGTFEVGSYGDVIDEWASSWLLDLGLENSGRNAHKKLNNYEVTSSVQRA